MSSPLVVTASVDSNVSSLVTSETSSSVKKCDQCDYTNDTERGLNQHIRMKHKINQIDGLEDSVLETPKKPGIEEKKSLADKVKFKEAEVQTDPGFVTVAVKEVSKTYDISVKESLKDRIEHTLDSVWNDNGITEFMVKKEHNIFSVDISCREFSESFTASSAVTLLTSLPWPDGISVIRSKPTRYLEKNQ